MSTTQAPYPLAAARALALHTQQLDAPPQADAPPGADAIYDTIDRVGWVQLDTLQMVQRSQYIALWSRLGPYETKDFDRLVFGNGTLEGTNDRRLFEYWMHAACIIPLSLYRFTIPAMRRHANPAGKRRREWLLDPANIAVLDEVMAYIRENGLARSADFERTDGRRGTWWDWKPAKIALEHLYNTGELTIANRVNFQRIYGITETVLPEWVNTASPTEEEAYLTLLDKSARALGVCAPMQIPDYFHMKRTPAKPLVQRMLDEGTLVPVNVELDDGPYAEQVVHRANLPLLERAADGGIIPRRATFLSPFDSLFWAKGRDMHYWGFQQILEAYKPAPAENMGLFLPAHPAQRQARRALRPQAGTPRSNPAPETSASGAGRTAGGRYGCGHRGRDAELHGISPRHRPRYRTEQATRSAAQAAQGDIACYLWGSNLPLCYNLPTAGAQPPMPSRVGKCRNWQTSMI